MPAAIGYRDFTRDPTVGSASITDSSTSGSADAGRPASNLLDDRRATLWAREGVSTLYMDSAAKAQLDLQVDCVDVSGTTGRPVWDTHSVGLLHLDNIAVFCPTESDGRLATVTMRVMVSNTAFGSTDLYDEQFTITQPKFGPGFSVVVPIGFNTSTAQSARAAVEQKGGFSVPGSSLTDPAPTLYIRIQIWTPVSYSYMSVYDVTMGSVRVTSALCFDLSDAGMGVSVADPTVVTRSKGQSAVANAASKAGTITGTMVNMDMDRVMDPRCGANHFNLVTGVSERVVFCPSVWRDEPGASVWTYTRSIGLAGLYLLDQPVSLNTVQKTGSDDVAWTGQFSMRGVVD